MSSLIPTITIFIDPYTIHKEETDEDDVGDGHSRPVGVDSLRYRG